MISIREGGTLSLNKGVGDFVFDGEGIEKNTSAYFISALGDLTINGAVFQNAKARGGTYYAPIKITGAKLTFNEGKIHANDYSGSGTAYSSGGIFLDKGASMEMNGGEISANQASNYLIHGSMLWSDSPGAGAIFVNSGASLVMNDGVIKANKGWGGGVLVGDPSPYTYNRGATSEGALKESALATAIFNGGTIESNRAVGGGAISGHGNVDIALPEGSTLVVQNNHAYQGGGIFVSDWAVDGIGLDKEIAKLPIETWSKYYQGRFSMASGTVQNNSATNCGGGINISTNGGHITGGEVLNNRAGDQGGGIYVTTVPYTLKLENIYVENNRAISGVTTISDGITLYSGSGGGVWFCPTGSATFHAENGAALVDNSARTEGADFWSSRKVQKQGDTYSVTLPERLLGGTKALYYNDRSGARYTEGSGESPKKVKDDKTEVALKAVVGEEKAITKALSNLHVIGNTASKGGGIGSNGNIIFGKDNPLKNIRLKKVWAEGTPAEAVTLELRARVGELDYLIEAIELNEDNDFSAVIKDLPATIGERPLEEVVYVKELGSEKYNTTISDIAESTEKTYALNLTLNRPEFSANENIHAVYNETTEIAINLHQKDKATVTKMMSMDRDTYTWKGKVNFEGIPISSENIEVIYYRAKDGGFISQYLKSYDVFLEEEGDKVILRLPRLYPDNVEEPDEPTGEEKVITASYQVLKDGSENDNKTFLFTVTNEKRALSLDVLKEWKGTSKANAPEVKIYLVKNGEKTDKFLLLNEANNWQGRFENLALRDSGRTEDNVYTLKEEGEENYKITLNGVSYQVTYKDGKVTNTREWTPMIPATTKLKVKKVWAGVEGLENLPPVTVYLYKNGQKTDKFITLTKENNWQGEFTNLLVVDTITSPVVNTYTVDEETVAGFAKAITGNVQEGFTVTNTFNKPKVKISKKALGGEGELVGASLELRQGDRLIEAWESTKEAKEITLGYGEYELKELKAPAGYALAEPIVFKVTEAGKVMLKVGDSWEALEANHLTMIDKPSTTPIVPATTKLKVKKIWTGIGNMENLPSVTVYLYKNGQKTDKFITLTKENNWQGEFTGLLVVDTITSPIVNTYTVDEEAILGFVKSVTGSMKEGYTIENRLPPGGGTYNPPPSPPSPPNPPPFIPDEPIVPPPTPKKPPIPLKPNKPNKPKPNKPLPKTGLVR